MSGTSRNGFDDDDLPDLDAALRAYRAGAHAQPPRELDDAIKAAARRAVGARPRAATVPSTVGQRTRRPWPRMIAVAATIVLTTSLALVTLRERDALDRRPVPSASSGSMVGTPVGEVVANPAAPAQPPTPAAAPAEAPAAGAVVPTLPEKPVRNRTLDAADATPDEAPRTGRPPPTRAVDTGTAPEAPTSPALQMQGIEAPATAKAAPATAQRARGGTRVEDLDGPSVASMRAKREEALASPPPPAAAATVPAPAPAAAAVVDVPASTPAAAAMAPEPHEEARRSSANDVEREVERAAPPAAPVVPSASRVMAPAARAYGAASAPARKATKAPVDPAADAAPDNAQADADSSAEHAAVDPPSPEEWLARIRILRRAGRAEQARAEFERLKHAYPDYPFAESDR